MDIEEEQKKHSYLDEYKIIKSLGAGYHAQVKLGVDEQGNYVAIKKYKKETATLATLEHQLNIMKNLEHENLIRLIAVREDATYKKKDETTYKCFAIILEQAGGGELFDFIAETGKFSEKVSRTYFHQMMNGLYYMHGKGYAHRDIKPENILLSADFVLKLADFGFSTLIKGKDNSGVLHTKLGTEGYMAPEIPLKNYEGKSVDIFAAGVILFIMYAGNPPFEKALPNDPYYKLIKDKKLQVFWKAHSRRRPVNFFSENFKKLFTSMVAFNPEERPTIQDIASHPWVKDAVSTHEEIKKEFLLRHEKLDLVLDARRKEQEKEKQKNMKAVTQQGSTHRGELDLESPFLEAYNNEQHVKRALQLVAEIYGDYSIVEDGTYKIALLKNFLKDHIINLEEAEEQDELLEDNNENKLKAVKVVDESGDKILVKYSYNYGTEEDQVEEYVDLSIKLGETKDGKLVVQFERDSGNILYYKRIIKDIRNQLL